MGIKLFYSSLFFLCCETNAPEFWKINYSYFPLERNSFFKRTHSFVELLFNAFHLRGKLKV